MGKVAKLNNFVRTGANYEKLQTVISLHKTNRKSYHLVKKIYLCVIFTEPGYPPTQYGMGTTTTVVMQQPAVVQVVTTNSPYPINTTCPNCRANVVTTVTYSDGLLVWLVAGGLCLVGYDHLCSLISPHKRPIYISYAEFTYDRALEKRSLSIDQLA